MQPTPCRLVATEAKNALKTESVDTVLLARYVPHCLEPDAQWLPSTFEDCARNHRSLVLARGASQLLACRRPCLAPHRILGTRTRQASELEQDRMRRPPRLETTGRTLGSYVGNQRLRWEVSLALSCICLNNESEVDTPLLYIKIGL